MLRQGVTSFSYIPQIGMLYFITSCTWGLPADFFFFCIHSYWSLRFRRPCHQQFRFIGRFYEFWSNRISAALLRSDDTLQRDNSVKVFRMVEGNIHFNEVNFGFNGRFE
jgi:hypothetical protein